MSEFNLYSGPGLKQSISMIAAALEHPALAAQGFFLTAQVESSQLNLLPGACHWTDGVVHSTEFEFNFKLTVPSRVPSFVFQRPCRLCRPYGTPRCAGERHERSCSGLGLGNANGCLVICAPSSSQAVESNRLVCRADDILRLPVYYFWRNSPEPSTI
jgi:hypothetical protein